MIMKFTDLASLLSSAPPLSAKPSPQTLRPDPSRMQLNCPIGCGPGSPRRRTQSAVPAACPIERRYAVIVQANELLPRSVVLVAPTFRSARPACP
jgi:hypothetical protein